MAVAKVRKIQIIAHDSHKEEILESLYENGFIEIINSQNEKEISSEQSTQSRELNQLEYKFAKANHALDVLSSFREEKLSILEKLNFDKPTVTSENISNLKEKISGYEVVAELIATYYQDLNSLKSLVIKLEEDIKLLSPWQDLALITAQDRETSYTQVVFGTMENSQYEELLADKGNFPARFALNSVNQIGTEHYLMLVVLKTELKEKIEYLEKYSFKPVELPNFDVTIKVRIKRLKQEIETIKTRIVKLEKRIRSEAKNHTENLEIIADILRWELDQEQIQENFQFTATTLSIIGWLPDKKKAKLEKKLKAITETVAINILPVEEDEEVPILMENSRFMKPFEFVTNIYGFPGYSEVDPTPFLAGFFIIFFGLCLTDAGYGLALGITTFLALKFLKLGKDLTKLLKVLFVGSIITFIAGGLTGGWFGIVLTDLGENWNWLTKPLIVIQQIDPVKNPITILIISIVLGYIHLLFGNAINLWWKAKHGELKKGLIDSGVWLYFLLTVGFWIVASRGIAFAGFAKIAVYLVYSSIALIIFTQGKSKNFVAKIFGGLAELYFGISGYISDILSYSRLLALGLATGIIGMVVNIVGSMVNEMIPYVGWLLMIIVLIGGHLLNLVISLVGAFIHSGRLQYVEFFKRFFDGGGKAFQPFIRQSVFVNYKNNK